MNLINNPNIDPIQSVIMQQLKIADVEEITEEQEEQNNQLIQQIEILPIEDDKYEKLPVKQFAEGLYTNPSFSQVGFIQNHPLIKKKLLYNEELCDIMYNDSRETPQIIHSMLKEENVKLILENMIDSPPFNNVRYFFTVALTGEDHETHLAYQQILLHPKKFRLTLNLFDDINFIFDVLQDRPENIQFATNFLEQTDFNMFHGGFLSAIIHTNMQKSKNHLEFYISQFQLLLGQELVGRLSLANNINSKNALLNINKDSKQFKKMPANPEHREFFQQQMQLLLTDEDFVASVISSNSSSENYYGLEKKIILLNHHNEYPHMNKHIKIGYQLIKSEIISNPRILPQLYNQLFIQELIEEDLNFLQDIFIRIPNLLISPAFQDVAIDYTQKYPQQTKNIFNKQLELFMNNIEQIFIQNFIVNNPALIEEMFTSNREFFMQRYETPFMQHFIEANQLRIGELFAQQQELLIIYNNIPIIQNFLENNQGIIANLFAQQQELLIVDSNIPIIQKFFMVPYTIDFEDLIINFSQLVIEYSDNIAMKHILNTYEENTFQVFDYEKNLVFQNRHKEYIINYCRNNADIRNNILQLCNDEEKTEYLKILDNN